MRLYANVYPANERASAELLDLSRDALGKKKERVQEGGGVCSCERGYKNIQLARILYLLAGFE